MHNIQVPGAEVKVYRVQDPVRGDDPQYFEDGVLDVEPITEQVIFWLRLKGSLLKPSSLDLYLLVLQLVVFVGYLFQ